MKVKIQYVPVEVRERWQEGCDLGLNILDRSLKELQSKTGARTLSYESVFLLLETVKDSVTRCFNVKRTTTH